MDVKRFALLLVVLSSPAHAQTMYVTDEVVITLRRGAGTEFAIIDNLRTGDAVEVLERDEANGYFRVRVRDSGDEGWVLTRYLVSAPTAGLELVDAQRSLAQARDQVAALQAELAATSNALSSTQAELSGLQATNSTMSVALDDIRTASADVIEIRNQNESLRRRNNELTGEIEALNAENVRLTSRSQQNWFVVGALVLAGGIVIGLVAPTLRRRRRTDW